MLNPKFGYVGRRAGAKLRVEAIHYYRCPACRQLVDKRDLAAVYHHEGSGHLPLPVEESARLDRIGTMLDALLTERDQS
ncbi:hypothetical protein ASE17_19665 [Phenylobacterium sp. Root77]|jgi:uncharacterized protein YlaI|uniref:hypothetical protein n=1 Tax=unclassified Phenylobacterium TaxID=2640670 RepID=UPI0006FF54F0|nr:MULTISPECIES: hypothetical protein [unclassified Phenylobacterium]KQW67013.1 hypothetical protein ASC73_17940 [Phenylobacterium sp. Root1277]KQW89706.1 hypothetical protein ASC79_18845 [Phenylobacterium sp. Root1290]KRC43426.1 hypothetical protein ASE17_19665 [Phenylobacterium sp. Root77]